MNALSMQTPGAWPVARGDVRLTGRASLPGAMAAPPQVAWQYAIEADEVWAAVDAVPGLERAPAMLEKPAADLRGSQWRLGPRLVDLHGDGRLVGDPGRAVKLLPEVPGLQTLEFPLVLEAPGTAPRQVVCYAHEGGRKREVWRSEVFDTVQNTNFVVADIDGDGRLEVAFAPHYRIIVLDGQSGRTKHLLKIHDLRNYGFFCATDVDGDGRLDFVVIADFAMHVDVVKNEGDRLRLLWRRDFEDNIQSKNRIVRPGPNPVFDVDGDGKVEIVFNFFNERDDGQWHVVALDAGSGARVADLPRRYMHGAADVNADGVPELFVSHSRDLLVPTRAPLELLRLREGKASVLWQYPEGAWVSAPSALPLSHSTIVARGTEEVPTAVLTGAGARGVFVRRTDLAGERLQAFVPGAAGAEEIWRVELPGRARPQWRGAADVDGDGVDEVLFSLRQAAAAAVSLGTTRGARVDILHWERRGTAERALVVAPASGGRPARIIFEGAQRDIVALEAPAAGKAVPSRCWQIPGAGPAIVAELNGDGVPEVVFAAWGSDGEGEMVAVDIDGNARWRRRVRGFPGPHPPWNFGGITSWWAGRYTRAEAQDLWVSARRSTMHSDEAWVLRGTDGETLWHLREVRTDQTGPRERGWGAGGAAVNSVDVDGDGLEDIVSLYPVNYMAARGSSGQLIHSVSAVSDLFAGVWGAYCTPLSADFNGDGRPELLWCGSYHHGLTTMDARVLWYHAGGAGVAGVADVNGDGRLELGFTGWEKGAGLRCLDAASGVQRWEWPLAGNPRVAVYSADVDGDGRDEFLFAVERTLYALQERDAAPHLVWQLELPAAPGDLALADVDGDGKIEILFIGADSVLYCLSAAPR